jgi:hypothetical protein
MLLNWTSGWLRAVSDWMIGVECRHTILMRAYKFRTTITDFRLSETPRHPFAVPSLRNTDVGHRWHYIAHALCMLDNEGYTHTHTHTHTRAHTHTHIIFNIYCFSTATMVTRTCLSVTLHVHCLTCRYLCRTSGKPARSGRGSRKNIWSRVAAREVPHVRTSS